MLDSKAYRKMAMNTQRLLPVGLIGLGSMGSYVAREILNGKTPGIRLVGVADIKTPSPDLLQELQSHSVPLVKSFEKLADFPIKLVIECATQKVVRECADFFITRGIDLLIMSVGALIQGSFLVDLADHAEEKRVHIYIPSGAVGAIDALQAAKLRGLDEVSLTTRKPPRSLGKIDGVNLEELREPRVLFEGPATEAVVKFSQNVNASRGTPFNNSVDMKGDCKIRKGLCGDQPALTLPGIGEFPGYSGQPFINEPGGGWLCRTKGRGHRS